jgi:hypothetical protein
MEVTEQSGCILTNKSRVRCRMGQSAVRRRAFFASHPNCVFCGGSAPATTVEHCPPRALFQHRAWPEGYEFPSCIPCNAGSSDDDLIIAFLARMNPVDEAGDRDGKVSGLMAQLERQHPGFLAAMMPTPSEARRINRSVGLTPLPGQSHQDAGAMHVPPKMDAAVKAFGSKLSKAVYYKGTGTAFPSNGEISLTWFTNFDLLRHGHFPVFKALQNIGGIMPTHVRSASALNDQFSIKWSLSDDHRVFVLQAMFGNAFGLVTFGCIERGVIGAKLAQLEAAAGPGPIALVHG